MSVRVLHPSIDDYENTVVIRGVIDPDSLDKLLVDYYQRELMPSTSRKHIKDALEKGERLPDIVLGMRGDQYDTDGEDIVLLNHTYIIDGQQRRGSILEYQNNSDAKPVRIGAVIHINTSATWEKELFTKLNQFQVKVSPNVLMRNNKDDHPVIATMYGLTKSDKNFVMYDRVSWTQNMLKCNLITATTMLHAIMRLHSHLAPGMTTGAAMLVPASDVLVERIGLPLVRHNIKAFFDLIDECWGIKRIHIKGGACYIKRTFLEVLAKVISDHPDFWKNDKRLEVGYLLKRKLASFPIQSDPEIMRLSGATGAAKTTLYFHLINHLNSGKRSKKLISRYPAVSFEAEAEDEAEDQETA